MLLLLLVVAGLILGQVKIFFESNSWSCKPFSTFKTVKVRARCAQVYQSW